MLRRLIVLLITALAGLLGSPGAPSATATTASATTTHAYDRSTPAFVGVAARGDLQAAAPLDASLGTSPFRGTDVGMAPVPPWGCSYVVSSPPGSKLRAASGQRSGGD
jgi:hypothetical protein